MSRTSGPGAPVAMARFQPKPRPNQPVICCSSMVASRKPCAVAGIFSPGRQGNTGRPYPGHAIGHHRPDRSQACRRRADKRIPQSNLISAKWQVRDHEGVWRGTRGFPGATVTSVLGTSGQPRTVTQKVQVSFGSPAPLDSRSIERRPGSAPFRTRSPTAPHRRGCCRSRRATTGVMRSTGRSAGPTCRAPSRPGVDRETA